MCLIGGEKKEHLVIIIIDINISSPSHPSHPIPSHSLFTHISSIASIAPPTCRHCALALGDLGTHSPNGRRPPPSPPRRTAHPLARHIHRRRHLPLCLGERTERRGEKHSNRHQLVVDRYSPGKEQPGPRRAHARARPSDRSTCTGVGQLQVVLGHQAACTGCMHGAWRLS